MTKLLGISGSLRKASFNTALLRAAVALAPSGTEIEIGSIAGIPLYDGDLEAEHGIPEPVKALKDRIAACEGLLIVTPEYNNAMPGVLKNAIDWLSRPPADLKRVFGDKPIALMGTSPGPFGTVLSQAAWLPVLRSLGARAYFGGRVAIPFASKAFDAEGALIDERGRKSVTDFLAGFVKSIGA
jgi:chromate reductase